MGAIFQQPPNQDHTGGVIAAQFLAHAHDGQPAARC
jgi:hypothetical protein